MYKDMSLDMSLDMLTLFEQVHRHAHIHAHTHVHMHVRRRACNFGMLNRYGNTRAARARIDMHEDMSIFVQRLLLISHSAQSLKQLVAARNLDAICRGHGDVGIPVLHVGLC